MPRFAALLAVLASVVVLVNTGASGAASSGPSALDAQLRAATLAEPGAPVTLSGVVPGGVDAVKLQLATPDGALRGPYGPFAVTGGHLDATLPAEATRGLTPTAETNYRLVAAVTALPAAATGTSEAAAREPAAGALTLAAPPAHPTLESSFVSSKGWVKPGDAFPLAVRVRNYATTPVDGGTVTARAPAGATFEKVSSGAALSGGTVTWEVGQVPGAGADGTPGVREIVIDAKAAAVAQDAKIVWKDLSITATGTATGEPVRSHGPKVIPPAETFDTARYGDRPFPVVPVDFTDRSHAADHPATALARKINDPANPGSTFNLYQEMSYGQLFPDGTVPSEGLATAGWNYGPGFSFSKRQIKPDTCAGTTGADLPGDTYQATHPERIKDGWYQLPGDTGYYGGDSNGSALIGAQAGVGALQQIDNGCGPAAKAVFDAAQIADPEIDYDDYDTDKDGVVDFFMMVFPGLGGNGDSQVNGQPPYDNIWPHSASLENAFTDPNGEKGYVTDDQRRDGEGHPLWYADTSRTKTTTEDKGDALKAFVRVGPYNVNPETAIDHASVISHEYGHSLGLPDFYTTGSRATYGSWTLMAEDHSQHMDVFGRQELGWLVPRVLEPKTETTVSAVDSTHDTHRIDWKTPSGTPYTLEGDGVHNGEGYVAKLPARQIIKPEKVPSGSHLWWSQAGNDFGCPPLKGHNLDIALPQLADVPAGTPVTLTLKSAWDIEWDFDYAFLMTSPDGKSFSSVPSANGYTTPSTQNPNSSDCQGQFGNGLTGSSASYKAGTQTVDRVLGEYGNTPEFVDDKFDISSLAGKAGVVRFAYATDPGLARPGWFIDDVVIKAGDRVLYSSDFEQAHDDALYNGGCREGLQTSAVCTKGWQYASAVDGSPADHAYYMELRDRAGFDLHGRGEDDRDSPSSETDGITFQPGLSLVYTDENHGYGNVGTDDPPAQSPLDSVPDDPTADKATPNLDDAAWTDQKDRNAFTDSGAGHLDNYSDPTQADGRWRFAYDCLSFDVKKMAGRDLGPENGPGDLTADITFRTGGGCAAFDYGYAGATEGSGAASEVAVPGATQGVGATAVPVACKATSAFRRGRVVRKGKGLRFDLAPSKGAATIDVLREGAKSAKRVLRFSGKRASFTWAGRLAGGKKLADGVYLVRMSSGGEVRRTGFVVRRGRVSILGATSYAASCGPLASAVLSGASFGGAKKRALTVRYALRQASRPTLTLLRGKKVLRTVRPAAPARKATFSARGLTAGTYRVIVAVKSGDTDQRAVLVARKR